uniref:Protein phosphatase 1 regulatory subunit 14 n=1 Tax=Bos taurus TaxID=9913 RepID=A0AAA9U183_BOVIN
WGRGSHAGQDSVNYISHNPILNRHLGRWAVAAWGLALQAARPSQLTHNLGLHHGSPPGAAGEGPGGADDEGPVRRQGKVTVKYDRKELRKRLNLEEWILEQLTRLYDCQEEEIPELEIDVDELLDMESDDTRAARVKELLVDCYKPTEAFISGLLDKIRGMQKLSTPQKNLVPDGGLSTAPLQFGYSSERRSILSSSTSNTKVAPPAGERWEQNEN